MNPRIRNIILLVVGVLVIGLGLWLMFFRSAPVEPIAEPVAEEPAPTGGLTASAPITSENTLPESPLAPAPAPDLPQDERIVVRQSAEIFAERYGSYSNQGQFQNLKDLLPLMTASYRAETEAYIEANESGTSTAAYQGVTSEKITASVEEFDGVVGDATVLVTLQQTKTVGTTSTVSYARILITLEREGEEWMVDDAEWQAS